nr:uncharacterized protein LOC128673655 [Plodia interpunctella]
MITVSVTLHVVVVYSVIVYSVKSENLDRYSLYILDWLRSVSFVIMLGVCAQGTQNDAQLLRRRLTKLLIDTLDSTFLSKYALRNLIRLVSIRTLRVQSFGSFDLNMTLPPACVAIFMSYTIIALQFNNVV